MQSWCMTRDRGVLLLCEWEYVRLDWAAYEKAGLEPKPNQSLGLVQEAGLFLIWISLVERLIWAIESSQRVSSIEELGYSYKGYD